MDSLIVPDLNVLRNWLDTLNIHWFECDSCKALHLQNMQNFDGIFDVKIDLIDEIILFSALAEVKPTALIPLVANLSHINASSLTAKAFVDIQDDDLPHLVVCQTLDASASISYQQFVHFIKRSEDQTLMIMAEACSDHLLMSEEDDSIKMYEKASLSLH